MFGSDEDPDGGYSKYVSEERYRAMLGEHAHKYKKRNNNINNTNNNNNHNNFSSPVLAYNGMPEMRSNFRPKDRKEARKLETASNFLPDMTPKLGNYGVDFSPQFDTNRFVLR